MAAQIMNGVRIVAATLVTGAITATGLSLAGVAGATCIPGNKAPAAGGCSKPSHPLGGTAPQQPVDPDQDTPTAGGVEVPANEAAPYNPFDSTPAGDINPPSAVPSAVQVAESMLGTDMFGPYGCEDFVDAAYGRTTANGIGHDQALNFYYSLANRGLGHHEMPIPAGALVFSKGPDGDHVDISRGDGTYISGGVQGLSRGYGDGHNVQILPAPNLGSWTLYGWAYAPW